MLFLELKSYAFFLKDGEVFRIDSENIYEALIESVGFLNIHPKEIICIKQLLE